MSIDIWPELDWSKAIRTPRTVLLEQNEILGKKSRGLLSLRVLMDRGKLDRFPEGAFVYQSYIYADKLSYSLDLLTVFHSITSPYPAIVREAKQKDLLEVADETEFLERLRGILGSQHWIQSMDRMISMSNS